jgi:NTE family protein
VRLFKEKNDLIKKYMTNIEISEKSLNKELEDILKYERKIKCDKSKITKLVIPGGGVKGFALLGGVHALEELNILKNITQYAGTSTGAIICAFLNFGMKPKEIFEAIFNDNLENMTNIKLSNLLTIFGLDDGNSMLLAIEKSIKSKGYSKTTTFKNLYDTTKKTLYIVVTSMHNKCPIYMSHLTHPNIEILQALRMSYSMPLFFSPVKYCDDYIIDGGCTENYPISLFAKPNDETADDVVGFFIKENDTQEKEREINNIEEYVVNIFQCMSSYDAKKRTNGYEKQTVVIKIDPIKCMSMHVDTKTRNKLFDSGYTATMQMF